MHLARVFFLLSSSRSRLRFLSFLFEPPPPSSLPCFFWLLSIFMWSWEQKKKKTHHTQTPLRSKEYCIDYTCTHSMFVILLLLSDILLCYVMLLRRERKKGQRKEGGRQRKREPTQKEKKKRRQMEGTGKDRRGRKRAAMWCDEEKNDNQESITEEFSVPGCVHLWVWWCGGRVLCKLNKEAGTGREQGNWEQDRETGSREHGRDHELMSMCVCTVYTYGMA